MKITKSTLKKLIKEELGRVLSEVTKAVRFKEEYTSPGGEITIPAGAKKNMKISKRDDGYYAEIEIGDGIEYIPESYFEYVHGRGVSGAPDDPRGSWGVPPPGGYSPVSGDR